MSAASGACDFRTNHICRVSIRPSQLGTFIPGLDLEDPSSKARRLTVTSIRRQVHSFPVEYVAERGPAARRMELRARRKERKIANYAAVIAAF